MFIDFQERCSVGFCKRSEQSNVAPIGSGDGSGCPKMARSGRSKMVQGPSWSKVPEIQDLAPIKAWFQSHQAFQSFRQKAVTRCGFQLLGNKEHCCKFAQHTHVNNLLIAPCNLLHNLIVCSCGHTNNIYIYINTATSPKMSFRRTMHTLTSGKI